VVDEVLGRSEICEELQLKAVVKLISSERVVDFESRNIFGTLN